MKNWTGERLETFIYTRDTIEHLHRYALVLNYIKDKVVLDIACGEGYGSNLMSKQAGFVYGVDIDNFSIEEAKSKYKKDNLEFLTGSASDIPIKDSSVDVVVSFETIEHHDQHDEMMTEIKRVLKPGGILIISTPDKLYYSDLRKFSNKFHVKELYKEEFSSLISKKFNHLQLLTQKYSSGNSIIQEERNQDDMVFFSGNYSDVNEEIINPLYLIAIASDDLFKVQKTSIFDGVAIVEREMQSKMRSSKSFKTGHFILFPFKFFKRKFK